MKMLLKKRVPYYALCKDQRIFRTTYTYKMFGMENLCSNKKSSTNILINKISYTTTCPKHCFGHVLRWEETIELTTSLALPPPLELKRHLFEVIQFRISE